LGGCPPQLLGDILAGKPGPSANTDGAFFFGEALEQLPQQYFLENLFGGAVARLGRFERSSGFGRVQRAAVQLAIRSADPRDAEIRQSLAGERMEMLDLAVPGFVLGDLAASLLDEVYDDGFVPKLRELAPEIGEQRLQGCADSFAERATAAVNKMKLG